MANQRPIAYNDFYLLSPNQGRTNLWVLDNDNDPEGGVLYMSSINTGSNYNDINWNSTHIWYTPPAGYVGRFTIDYYAKDSGGAVSNRAQALVVVDTPPSFVTGDVFTVQENYSLVGTVLATDPDPNASIAYKIVGGADGSKFKLDSATRVLSFVSAPNFESLGSAAGSNTYVVDVEARDNLDIATVQTLTVYVLNANEAPVINAPNQPIQAWEDYLVLLRGSDGVILSDPDGSGRIEQVTLTATRGDFTIVGSKAGITIDAGATSRTATLHGSVDALNGYLADLRFMPDENYSGEASLKIDVTDEGLGSWAPLSASKTIRMNVQARNDAPVVAAGQVSAQLVEASPEGAGVESAVTQLYRWDVDGTAPSFLTAGFTDVGAGLYRIDGVYGAAVLNVVTGELAYTLDNARAATLGLAPGEAVTERFAISVTDGSATGATEAVFSILGTAKHRVGDGAANVFTGSVGDDHLEGFGGDDILVGGAGSDRLDGGEGVDTAIYGGLARAYALGGTGAAATVHGGPEGGTDALTGVERIQFVDGVMSFDPNGHAAQVYRLYDAVLHPAPDSWGLNAWVHALEGGMSLTQVASAMVGSSEFQSNTGGLSTAQFVAYLYQTALHRDADADGAAYWTRQIDTGAASRAEVVLTFSESAEHLGYTAGASNAGLFIYDQDYADIAYLFDAAFDRPSDMGGLIYWVGQREAGMSLDAIADSFVASAEFQNDIAGKDHAGVVDYIYNTVLDRDPDAGGRQYWTGQLDDGLSYGAFLALFSQSVEHQILMQPAVDHGILYG